MLSEESGGHSYSRKMKIKTDTCVAIEVDQRIKVRRAVIHENVSVINCWKDSSCCTRLSIG